MLEFSCWWSPVTCKKINYLLCFVKALTMGASIGYLAIQYFVVRQIRGTIGASAIMTPPHLTRRMPGDGRKLVLMSCSLPQSSPLCQNLRWHRRNH
jgi:hypothetical protein